MQIMSRFESSRKWVKAAVCLAGGSAAVALAFDSASAQAATTTCTLAGKDCTFTISNNSIQKVPLLFKLQAQISQAKLPVTDAIFSTLLVKIKSGNAELCNESFSQVRVRGGVLNLEIGRHVQGCQLDDTFAKHNDLAFQICIGDSGSEAGNCLKPIQMSAVPYALTANFASQSQEAYRAELASRAQYAQRLTADGSMLELQQIGTGYYDFQTPTAAQLTTLQQVNQPEAANVRGGFVQWTAVDPLDSVLNISAKDIVSNNPARLEGLYFHSVQSNFWGKLNVLDYTKLHNGLWVGGLVSTLTSGLNVMGGTIQSQVDANFYKEFNSLGLATFSGGLNATAGTVRIATDTEFTKGFVVSLGAGVFGSGLIVTGGVVTVQSSATFVQGITASATSTFTKGLTVPSGGTVEMSAATVNLPNASVKNANLGLAVSEITADSAGISDCLLGPIGLNTKFCGITKIVHKSGAATPSCTISKSGTGYRLQACGATCAASCF